eukprot:1526248-Lingulodinium_polyedra.AAC.1
MLNWEANAFDVLERTRGGTGFLHHLAKGIGELRITEAYAGVSVLTTSVELLAAKLEQRLGMAHGTIDAKHLAAIEWNKDAQSELLNMPHHCRYHHVFGDMEDFFVHA